METIEPTSPTPIKKIETVDELTDRVNRHISEEVEKRVSAWLTATHGTDFVEHLKQVSALNATLRAHNTRFFNLLKECYATIKESFDALPAQPEAEWPILYKLRTTLESVRQIKKPTGRIIAP